MFVLLSEVGLEARNLKNGVTWLSSRSTKNSVQVSVPFTFYPSFEHNGKNFIVFSFFCSFAAN